MPVIPKPACSKAGWSTAGRAAPSTSGSGSIAGSRTSEGIGGKLVIESVTPERMDAIALQNDLTVLAAGKADLGRLIPRDERRSY